MKNKSQTDSYFRSILINVKMLEQFLFFAILHSSIILVKSFKLIT